ncbi:hypothetical protein SPWS13_2893 [Shewanella putrefaciens]|nr:hypothetical protein SPWS13_2893 [Shewanella putrefaciens]
MENAHGYLTLSLAKSKLLIDKYSTKLVLYKRALSQRTAQWMESARESV